jgi:hypothetical protein
MRRLLPLACTAAAAALSALPSSAQGTATPGAPVTVPVDPDWAFRPLAVTEPPRAGEAEWDTNAIDRFVWHGLRAANLTPAPRADRRTLLRRATFVLTGLPPAPADVDAFLADGDADGAAFARVVERLLGSFAHAEAQARHWLDLARYSDSNGLDENLAFGNAWRYRDWVVGAHHRDVPFDRFVTLQLAGDLLAHEPGVGLDGHVATGFLALGPRMLAEQDKAKLVLDTVDEQLDLVGRTVLGLTLGCARCHDHKFDPVSQRDYTALAGVFRSTKSFHDLEHVSKWFDRELADDAAVAARAAAVAARDAAAKAHADAAAAALTAARADVAQRVDELRAAAAALQRDAVLVQAEAAVKTSLGADARQWGDATATVLHTRRAGPQFAEWTVAVPRAGRWALLARFAAAESRPLRLACDGAVVAERALAATTGGWLPVHQRWHEVAVLELAGSAHVLRADALGANVPHLDALCLLPLAVGEAPASPSDAAPATIVVATSGASPRPAVRAIAAALALGVGDPFALTDDVLRSMRPAAEKDELTRLAAAAEAARAAVPPDGPTALCVGDGTATDLPLLLRGDHTNPAAARTPRGVPAVLASFVPAPTMPANASGRLELARWLFAPEQALPARVHVNRIWQRAFGDALVRTPSNFGRRGDRPVHAALLDWLAADFRAHGWSQRHVWRTLLATRTWQQASRTEPAVLAADPDNRLHGRQRRQRIPAEAVRDAILLVAGTLDAKRGGTLLPTADRGYVTNDQSADAARYDAPRRSLYLPIVRNAMYEMFTAFDYPDPSVHLEQRPQSTTATQALWLLNAPFVREQARAFAARAEAAAPGDGADDARIDFLWREAFARAPSSTERAAAHRWLAHARGNGASAHALPGLAQALFATNEFVYVD